MPRPIRVPHHDREQQLSTTALTPTEAAGDLAKHLGLKPNRSLQPPRQRVGQQHVCFVWAWPLPSQHHPRPKPLI